MTQHSLIASNNSSKNTSHQPLQLRPTRARELLAVSPRSGFGQGVVMTRSRRAKEKGDKRGRRRLTQTTLAGQILEDEDNKHYGDAIGIKKEGIVRIGYQNVNRIPVDGRTGKSRKVVDTIRNSGATSCARQQPRTP